MLISNILAFLFCEKLFVREFETFSFAVSETVIDT